MKNPFKKKIQTQEPRFSKLQLEALGSTIDLLRSSCKFFSRNTKDIAGNGKQD